MSTPTQVLRSSEGAQAAPEVADPTAPAPRRLTGRRRGDGLAAAVFITPGAIFFVAFIVLPALGGLALSFYEWDLFTTPRFVGVDNFVRLFTDPAVAKSLAVSAGFLILGVVPTTILGFLLAVLVNTPMRGIGVVRVLYFTPLVASSAVTTAIWLNIFRPRGGVLNQVLSWVGIEGKNWLNDPALALPSLVVVLIWGALPLVIIIYLSGLQRVPQDIYDASSLDGAGRWRQTWSMTWPSVLPTTVVVLLLQFLAFLSGSFEIALIMTRGGPLGATTSLALYAYREAFEKRDIGYASALSFFQLLLILALFLIGRSVFSIVRRVR